MEFSNYIYELYDSLTLCTTLCINCLMKIDASPLIYAIKADIFDLFYIHYSPIRITNSIYQELVVQGKVKGYTDAFVIEKFVNTKKIHVEPDLLVEHNSLNQLGQGEQTAITEAKANDELLILDDRKARNRAKQLNVTVLGTDSLLLELCLSNIIDYGIFELKLKALANAMSMKGSKVVHLLQLAKKKRNGKSNE